MPTINVTQSVTIGGVTIAGQYTQSGESPLAYEPVTPLPAAKAGTLSTRTDANTGVLTLGSGHGLQENDVVSVFWASGSRYNLDVGTPSGATLVPIDGGAGDDLPTQGTAITVCLQTEAEFLFSGDNAKVIAISANRRAVVLLAGSDDTVHLPADIQAGGSYQWNGQGANPVSGDSVAKLVMANGDASQALTVKAGVLLDV